MVDNKSIVDFQFEVIGNLDYSSRFIDKVFPFPNPFSDYTAFTMFVLTVAAAEAAIGLAIIVVYFRNTGSIQVEDISSMKG